MTLTEMTFYSQYGQDRYIIEDLFPGNKDGVFVEVGAHDGMSGSNTYALEQLGWTGLLVEPNPDMEISLLSNRRAVVEMCCAGNGRGSLTYRKISGPCDVLGGIVACYDLRHMNRIKREVAENGGTITDIQVPVKPLSIILRSSNIYHVDYLSIDTEGSEIYVLKGIDWSDVSIDVISVENNYGENDVREYLEEHGYAHINRIGIDDFYRHEM